MKILITGASGFIASHLLKTLVPSKDLFLYVRDEDEAKKLKKSGWNIFSEKAVLGKIPRGIESVIHLAGTAGGTLRECISGNAVLTAKILCMMDRLQIPNIVFLSAGAVYGDINKTADENSASDPSTPYGITKMIA